jgi:hypothetical protein
MKKGFFFSLLIFLLFYNSFAFSQKNYYKGYFVTNANDTIHCKIKKFISNALNCSYIKVLDTNNGKKRYTVKDIKSYKRGEDTYVRKKYIVLSDLSYTYDSAFMKIIEKGHATLYRYDYYNVKDIPYSYGMLPSDQEPQFDYYLENNEGEFIMIPKYDFGEVIAPIFINDYSFFMEALKEEFNYSEIKEFVKEYNQKIAREENEP